MWDCCFGARQKYSVRRGHIFSPLSLEAWDFSLSVSAAFRKFAVNYYSYLLDLHHSLAQIAIVSAALEREKWRRRESIARRGTASSVMARNDEDLSHVYADSICPRPRKKAIGVCSE